MSRFFGIIPAGAGHFLRLWTQWPFQGDHPRRCGALPNMDLIPFIKPGSSPQVRGTFPAAMPNGFHYGIIPAGAGHFATAASAGDAWLGSSPQVRGTFGLGRGLARLKGIIPAGAGHFCALPRLCGDKRDHPRRCGALATPPPATGNG